MKLLSNCYKLRRNKINRYLESRQLEFDLEIIEKQLHRLTQEVRLVNSELAKLVEAIRAAKGPQKP